MYTVPFVPESRPALLPSAVPVPSQVLPREGLAVPRADGSVQPAPGAMINGDIWLPPAQFVTAALPAASTQLNGCLGNVPRVHLNLGVYTFIKMGMSLLSNITSM